MPVQRSLALDYSHDERVFKGTYHHQYLFGPFVMVVPIESNKDLARVFFPPGDWYYLFDGRRIRGDQETIVESPIHKLPVFIKAGAIIPMQKPALHTKEKQEELILHVYHGNEDTQFDFYEDDGATFEFENGDCAVRSLHFSNSLRKIVVGQVKGNYKSTLKRIRIVLHGFDPATALTIDGKLQSGNTKKHSFFLPLEKYDPINDPDSMGEEEIIEWTGDLSSEKMEFNF